MLLEKGDIDGAERLEQESSQALEALQATYFLAHNIQFRAAIALSKGSINKGLSFLNQSILLSEKVGDLVNISNCKATINGLVKKDLPEGQPIKIGFSKMNYREK